MKDKDIQDFIKDAFCEVLARAIDERDGDILTGLEVWEILDSVDSSWAETIPQGVLDSFTASAKEFVAAWIDRFPEE